VEKIDAKENLVSVKKRTGKQVTYDPRRLQGVTLYREADRAFSRGDRVQFTAPDREQHIANRELASVEKIDRKGNIQLRLDSGRSVAFNIKENPHLDYGYAVTSHSSQGQTADRVLVHVDTEQASEKLVNRRLAYGGVAWTIRRANLHQRQNPACRRAGSRCFAPNCNAAAPRIGRTFQAGVTGGGARAGT
jgi:hypothetical protein